MERALNESVRPFDGSSEVSTWMKKIKLVARLKKIEDLAAFIALFLEGPAFEVYDHLDKDDKDDGDAIGKALLCAFGQNKFSAYDSFRQRNWKPGSSYYLRRPE